MKTIFVVLSAILFCFINNCDSGKDIPREAVIAPVIEISPTPTPGNISNETVSEPPPEPPKQSEKPPLEYANNRDQALFEAIERGGEGAAQIKALLERGADVNAKVKTFKCADGEPAFLTVLGKSVEAKNSEIARLLLERGANVNDYFYCGSRVHLNFPRAVVNQDVPMMKVLTEFGAETDKNNNGNQILVSAKSKEVFDYLIDIGFDVNARDKIHGFTPLFLAVRDNNLDLVKAILRHKPDLKITTEPTKINGYEELTVLQLAEGIGNKQIIRELKKADANR